MWVAAAKSQPNVLGIARLGRRRLLPVIAGSGRRWHTEGPAGTHSWGTQHCPFETLGLKKGAPEADVKKAYFELAKKCHPDVYEAPDAELRFQEISRAYTLLIDEDTRHSYESQAGIYSSGEINTHDIFDRVFKDHRLRNPVQAVEERALFAITEAKRGNDKFLRDFCVDYRLPPQFFLPNKPQLVANPGEDSGVAPDGDDSRNSIGDMFSKSPISGGG